MVKGEEGGREEERAQFGSVIGGGEFEQVFLAPARACLGGVCCVLCVFILIKKKEKKRR